MSDGRKEAAHKSAAGAVVSCIAVAYLHLFLVAVTCGLMAAGAEPVSSVLYSREYAGMADGGDRLSCVDLFVLHSDAQFCQSLASKVSGVEIEMCQTASNTSLLVIYAPESERMVFTVRAIGRQVVTVPLAYCSTTERLESTVSDRGTCDLSTPVHSSAVYGLLGSQGGLIPGRYHMHIQLLYQGFSLGKGNMRVSTDTPHAKDLFAPASTVAFVIFNVTRATPDAAGTATVQQRQAAAGGSADVPVHSALPNFEACSYCHKQRERWGLCNQTYVEGAWLTTLHQDSEAPLLSLPDVLSRKHNASLLHWQPKGCHFMPLARLNVSDCLIKKHMHVCFVGDSQVRHMYDGFVDELINPSNTILNRVVANETWKEVLDHPNATYYPMRYSEGEAGWVSNAHLDKCTHVFFNFGQWPLSFQPPARWALRHYLKVLRKLLVDVKAYEQHRKGNIHFYWLQINSVARGIWHIPCADHRFNPVVELFNAAANRMVDLYGITTVNTFGIVQPANELAYDGSHFHWLASVGHYISTYLANVLCVQQ